MLGKSTQQSRLEKWIFGCLLSAARFFSPTSLYLICESYNASNRFRHLKL